MSHGHLPSIEVHKYSDEGNNELFAANGDLQLDPSLSDIAIQVTASPSCLISQLEEASWRRR